MSRPGARTAALLATAPPWLDVAIEIAALLAAALAVALVALRGRSLSGAVAPWRPLLPLALAVLLGLLALRSRRSRAGPHVRPAWPRAAWLAGAGNPRPPARRACSSACSSPCRRGPRRSEPTGGSTSSSWAAFSSAGGPSLTRAPSPGAVVLWAPFYLLGHGVALGARALGIDVAANGESEPYRNALRLGAAVYGLLAAVFAQRAASRFVSPLLASVCAAGLLARLYALSLHGGRAGDGTRSRRGGQQPAPPAVAPRARGARARAGGGSPSPSWAAFS